jgi:glutamyl-tRNA(Gln) amidotransferase subunit E
LLFDSKWPDYAGSERELKKIRRKLGCGEQDAMAVVWGPEEDTFTAAKEVGIRYSDAIDGIPNETRQPFADGSTDFERILPGPDRMYPDTDSPPIRMTRERVARLKKNLPPPPWIREERYGKARVPKDTVYFLIRRGGARLVDLVVEYCGTDLRRACFFFGAHIKGLRRAGVPVDSIGDERWLELFKQLSERPVLFEIINDLTETVAREPSKSVQEILDEKGLNDDPLDWEKRVVDASKLRPDHDNGLVDKRVKFSMGRVMQGLRGRVPAEEVLGRLLKLMDGAK